MLCSLISHHLGMVETKSDENGTVRGSSAKEDDWFANFGKPLA